MEEINQIEEQMEEIKLKIIEIFEPVVKTIKNLYRAIKENFTKIWLSFKNSIEKYQKIRKYIHIYNKTRNWRIKKKQKARIRNLFYREVKRL